jgi:hypothetical protein
MKLVYLMPQNQRDENKCVGIYGFLLYRERIKTNGCCNKIKELKVHTTGEAVLLIASLEKTTTHDSHL